MLCSNLGVWPTPKKDTQCLSQDEENWMLWNGNGLWLGLKLHDKENKFQDSRQQQNLGFATKY